MRRGAGGGRAAFLYGLCSIPSAAGIPERMVDEAEMMLAALLLLLLLRLQSVRRKEVRLEMCNSAVRKLDRIKLDSPMTLV